MQTDKVKRPQIPASKLLSLLSKQGSEATIKWYAEKCGLSFDNAAQAVAFQLFKSCDEQDVVLFDLLLCQSLWSKYKLANEDIKELISHALSFGRDERDSELEMKLYKWHILYPHYEYIIHSLYCLFPELRQKNILSQQQAETICCERLEIAETKQSLPRAQASQPFSSIAPNYYGNKKHNGVTKTSNEKKEVRKKIKHSSPTSLIYCAICVFVLSLVNPLAILCIRTMFSGGDGGDVLGLLLPNALFRVISLSMIMLAKHYEKKDKRPIEISAIGVIIAVLLTMFLSILFFCVIDIGIMTTVLFLFFCLWLWATWKDMCERNRTGSCFYYIFLVFFMLVLLGVAGSVLLEHFKKLYID